MQALFSIEQDSTQRNNLVKVRYELDIDSARFWESFSENYIDYTI